MNAVTVKINGVEYNLKGEENKEYLEEVALSVDNKIKEIMRCNEKLDTYSAAVLTALNTVDESYKIKEKIEEHKEKLLSKDEVIKKLNSEIQDFKDQLKILQGYNEELLKKLASDRNEIVIREKEKEVESLKEQIDIFEKEEKKNLAEIKSLSEKNKELKFSFQTAKYKILDLTKRLQESNFELAKTKSIKTPYLKSSNK